MLSTDLSVRRRVDIGVRRTVGALGDEITLFAQHLHQAQNILQRSLHLLLRPAEMGG